MQRWLGRVALITGANTDIGESICKKLIQRGMIVFGCTKDEEGMERMKTITRGVEMSEYRQQMHRWKCDLAVEADIMEMHNEIRTRFGRLDVCLNFADPIIDSSLLTGKTEDWRYMIEVGILGLCINTREAIKLMREKGEEGQIIHLGSISSHKILSHEKPVDNSPDTWYYFYNSTRWMLRALTECYRHELRASKSRIRVATISQYDVEKELMNYIDFVELYGGPYIYVQPDDIANAVNYILDTPSHINVNDVIIEATTFTV